MKTTHKIEDYTVTICQDECPANPFEEWGCEPPLLAFYGTRIGSHKAYNGAPADWYDVLRLLPDSIWQRGQRVAFLRRYLVEVGVASFREIAEAVQNEGDLSVAVASLLADKFGKSPEGWQAAENWMETAASILEYGGIPCHQTQSNGYCQGDSTLLLVVATPAWVQSVGAPADSLPGQLEAACRLHGQWQWGDVYGVPKIEDANGDKIPDSSCWGFYGDDHEASGLLDHAREAIRAHEARNARQAEHLTAALCSAE